MKLIEKAYLVWDALFAHILQIGVRTCVDNYIQKH